MDALQNAPRLALLGCALRRIVALVVQGSAVAHVEGSHVAASAMAAAPLVDAEENAAAVLLLVSILHSFSITQ